jgi:hypothetical protein
MPAATVVPLAAGIFDHDERNAVVVPGVPPSGRSSSMQMGHAAVRKTA